MVRRLDIHPALGFETHERWKVAVAQRSQLVVECKAAGTAHSQSFLRIKLFNIAKVVGYIPGLNVIVGIARIVMSAQSISHYSSKIEKNLLDEEKKAISIRHLYRGVAEIFLGPLLLIADIIQTIFDHLVVKEYNANPPLPANPRSNIVKPTISPRLKGLASKFGETIVQ